MTSGENLVEVCGESTRVPLHKGGKRMVALSFDLTEPASQDLPASEKITKTGSVKIVPSGGVGDSAYATGFSIKSTYFRYTHGDYSVLTSKEHRTFIAWLVFYANVLFLRFVFLKMTRMCSGIIGCRYKGTQTIDLSNTWSCGVPIFGDPTNSVSVAVLFPSSYLHLSVINIYSFAFCVHSPKAIKSIAYFVSGLRCYIRSIWSEQLLDTCECKLIACLMSTGLHGALHGFGMPWHTFCNSGVVVCQREVWHAELGNILSFISSNMFVSTPMCFCAM